MAGTLRAVTLLHDAGRLWLAVTALFGALVIATIANGLNTLNLTQGVIFITTGGILLFAVTLDTILRRLGASDITLCDLALREGRKCFYTTPIKALSNQKYADLVARYGDFVLYRPPVKATTLLLWFGPLLLLVIGIAALFYRLSRRRVAVAPAQLSESDRARAAALLGTNDAGESR